MWFLYCIKTQKVQGLQEEVEKAPFRKDKTALDTLHAGLGSWASSLKVSKPLSILTYVKENDTYLPQPHRVLSKSKEIWMSLKSSLLLPSLKVALFGQNPVAESNWVRRWG